MRLPLAIAAAAYAVIGPASSIAAREIVPAASLEQKTGDQAAITHHRGVFNGQSIGYTATVEGLKVTSGTDGATARVVSFAYTRDKTNPQTRPVMFVFNGGPIVASPFLHIGGLGPRRIGFPDDVKADPSTFKLIDNTYSPLDAVDLVFVDPASTGFSRVVPGTRAEQYYSVPADAAQFAAFIRLWMKTHGRSGAPVYLFGESYGTNRAAAVAGQLSEGPDPLPLSGVFIYGQAVNIIEYAQRPANIISYVASLPTVAAIGWYHERVERRGRTLQQFMSDANDFAKGDYLAALYQGNLLPDAERRQIAGRLQEFSGIPAAWYLANDLRMTKERYRIELLKDRGLLIGRNDARYAAPITDRGGASDPSDVLSTAVIKIFPDFIKRELGVTWSEPYIIAAPIRGLDGWGWGYGNSPFSDWPYAQGLSKMMAINPKARIVVGNGYFDTQTTMGAAEFLVRQSNWDAARTSLRFYDGGHMGYSVSATAKAIADDIRTLVR